MVLVPFLLVATAAALDVMVTCSSSPRYYTIDGMPNRQISVIAGETIFFHFDVGCSGHPMQIEKIDGTPFPMMGPHTMLATHAGTPECLIYRCMTHPLTMTGTISVIGGMPCGATVTAATTLYNRPIITPLPAPVVPAPVIYPTLPTTTTTTIYPPATTIYATATLTTPLYAPTTTLYPLPPVCPARACPAISCVLPAYQRSDIMADGCPGCPYCFSPPVTIPPVTVLPPIICPVRTCPVMPVCIPPFVSRTDVDAHGCQSCPYCALPAPLPMPSVGLYGSLGLYSLPCCPSPVLGQACRNCLAFV